MGSSIDTIERIALSLVDAGKGGTSTAALRWEERFAEMIAAMRPRIARLVRQYGLTDMADDAEQVCAIGIFRALQSYDPARSRFATHATWQMRGELQGLRHRMRLDQRQSARNAGVWTVSIQALQMRTASENRVFEIVDDAAERRAESGASELLAFRALDGMMDRIGSPDHERAILYDALSDRDPPGTAHGKTREQRRQVVRRAFRNCAKLLAA